ncbi:hypothetical protein [Wolbachia endosymbiont of Folsomia candida]|uniref:hypothetical protein n=1 Tax=Wolbachia endosymbiont of Folsomia candida TaxID=169402 RepID=UPI000AC9CF5C|nr:hypothetical protein [Wolbachia endosymbiont of Folsomia candida]APR98932.1 hypothetical protein ASM33_07015 [Wolbachia endosymbiont of Folsomia candida]
MVRAWLYDNICQPVKKCYNYITGKTGESSDTKVASEGSADHLVHNIQGDVPSSQDDMLLFQDNISTSGNNDIL